VGYGRDKLTRKGLDAIVVNDISKPGIGFDSELNEVSILTASGGALHVARTSKQEIASAVLDEVQSLRGLQREGRGGAARADAGSPARV
jgi:phosphopantothenoylcysteine decarboxylase/phosphopantothenate--cysteine ligase